MIIHFMSPNNLGFLVNVKKKKLFYRHLNIYMSNKHDCDFHRNMVSARSEYKKAMRHCRYEHRKSQTESWLTVEVKMPKTIGKC